MPFKSQAQWKDCYRRRDPDWDCDEFADESPDFAELPPYAPNGYYPVSELGSIEEAVERWRDGDKPYDHSFFYIDTEELWPYREYTRTRTGGRRTPEEWDELYDAMEEEGWKQEHPAFLIVHPDGLRVGEGNHRLAIARELGIEEVPVRFSGFYKSPLANFTPNPKTDDQVYDEWKKLVNMTPKELRQFMKSGYGKVAGLSKEQAEKQGIGRGWDSANAILRMKKKGKTNWNAEDWRWARRQVSFIKRMRGNRGPLEKPDGEPTRKLLSLLIWGHNPYL